ncbi:MAG TPA: OB-fold domain-containing protein [Acidimicrobiales bacterium]
MGGILAYGAYVPYNRLERSEIGAALGGPGGRGTRAVASYDEDSTSMAVEAARLALRSAPSGTRPEALYVSTTSPPYLDKTNATAVHAALGLDPGAVAADLNGSVRSAVAALGLALDTAGPGGRPDGTARGPTLVVASDVRTGLAGGADERDGGDGAVAVLVGAGEPGLPVLAEPVAATSSTAEFLDRWRNPGQIASKVWEERFGEHAYVPLAEAAFTHALKDAGITADEVDHLLVTGTHSRAARRFLALSGVRREAVAPDLTPSIGNAGAAQPGLMLAAALDRAAPGQIVAMVTLSDGADVRLFRTTDALTEYTSGRTASTLAEQIESGRPGLSYTSFLTWRGQLVREPPRRPDPEAPAAPASFRSEAWKLGFTGSRCTACGTRHLPPTRVCVHCRAVDHMVPERLADVPATVATFTVDRLAFSLSPPVVAAVVDFDGGGRFRCELTDVDPEAVAIGDRVEMTFRRLFTANGVHNYFWKARPVRATQEEVQG